MKEFWNTIQFLSAGMGGWLGWFLGGVDGLLYALIAFAVVDYITGVMCAVSDKSLSSAVGCSGSVSRMAFVICTEASRSWWRSMSVAPSAAYMKPRNATVSAAAVIR